MEPGVASLDQPLNALERRVLGALLEKSLAQPEYYPLTLNALVAACNQKSNRDPVMELDEEAIWQTLEALRVRGLASKVLAGGGGRTDRFKHEVDVKLGWPKAQKAVMTELLLRGPQTIGELRTRASRLYVFDNLESVAAVLDWLAALEPPAVAPLPRAPGQSAIRFTHLFYPPEEQPAIASAAESSTPSTSMAEAGRSAGVMSAAPILRHAPSSSASNADTTPFTANAGETERLREQLENLQAELADLHEELAALRRRVETLEQR